ncbi:MAG: site-specific integrase [Actinomycetota bacterium]|nr:site-specific integrase [Actinomycetota bacterium]
MRGRIIAPDKGPGARGRRTSWAAVIDLPPLRGKRRRRQVGGFSTKKSCQAAMAADLTQLGKGRDPFSDDVTFEAYASEWLVQRRSDGLRATTVHRYRELLDDPSVDLVRSMELRKIRPAHVRAVIEAMGRRGLSTATIVQARAVCGSLMKTALVDGISETNPVTAVKRPRTATTTEKHIPSPEEVKAILDAARDTEWEMPLLVAAATGARRSEVLAVRWSDLSLDSGELRIVRGVHWCRDAHGQRSLQFLDPKTQRSRRSIGLPDSVVVRLRQHRKAQLERRVAHGAAWADHDLVFERGDGAPLDPDAMTKAFKRFTTQAGCPRARLHSLRHAAATQMARGGVHPKAVSSALGHASVAFTLSVSTSDWDEGRKQTANAIGDALGL